MILTSLREALAALFAGEKWAVVDDDNPRARDVQKAKSIELPIN